MTELFNNFIIPFMTGLFKSMINVFTAPLYAVIKTLVPDFTQHLQDVNLFINGNLLTGMQFVKMSILNLTGINHNIWQFVSFSLVIALYIYLSLNFVKLAYNLWTIFHGTKKID